MTDGDRWRIKAFALRCKSDKDEMIYKSAELG